MAEIKFSCSNCGQHISCDEPWSGHQIQCPACHNTLTVPHFQTAAQAGAQPQPTVPQSPVSNRPKLSAGLTQVPARSTPTAPVPQRRPPPPPAKSKNSLLGYAVLAVVLLVVGVAAYNYLPALISQVQDTGSSLKNAGSTSANRPGSAGGGPMGEVNEAMDASDTLDGGVATSRPRPSATKAPTSVPGTNAPAKPTRPRNPGQ